MPNQYIRKEDLIIGEYYEGVCRNGELARWNGRVFLYRRFKFGTCFIEEIRCPEDDQVYDVFYAHKLVEQVTEDKELPLTTVMTTVK